MEHPPPSSPTTAATGTAGAGPRRSRWSGKVIAVVGLAALAGLAWYLTHRAPAPATGGFGPRGTSGARGAPPSTVGVATASRADIPVIIEALGTVVSAASVTVHAAGLGRGHPGALQGRPDRAEGRGARDHRPEAVRDGARPGEWRALARRSRSSMRRACCWSATGRCSSEDSIARQTVDTQDALVQQLAGTVALDRANEDSARLNLQWSRIVAPVAGRVGLRPIDAGNYIAAGERERGRDDHPGLADRRPVLDSPGPHPRREAAHRRRRDTAGDGLGQRAHAPARGRQLPDARQPDRHPDRHHQGQGALREHQRRAVSRTSSSTCGCCCARSTAPSSSR